MAHRVVLETENTSNASLDAVESEIETKLREHLSKLRTVRIEARRAGPGGRRWLPEVLEVTPTTDPTELEREARELTVDVVALIAKDSGGDRWRGEIVGYSAGGTSKRDELFRHEVKLDPEAFERPTKGDEVVAMIGIFSSHMKAMLTGIEKIIAASGAREEAVAKLVVGVSDSVGKETSARYEYEWKMQESRERMHKHEVDEESRVHRGAATKFAFADILSRYQPTFDVIARAWAAREGATVGAPGATDMPPRPTADEVEKIFAGEDYADIRSVALAMVAAADPLELAALRTQAQSELVKLGPKLRNLQMQAEAAVGAKRVGEILAWVRRPW